MKVKAKPKPYATRPLKTHKELVKAAYQRGYKRGYLDGSTKQRHGIDPYPLWFDAR